MAPRKIGLLIAGAAGLLTGGAMFGLGLRRGMQETRAVRDAPPAAADKAAPPAAADKAAPPAAAGAAAPMGAAGAAAPWKHKDTPLGAPRDGTASDAVAQTDASAAARSSASRDHKPRPLEKSRPGGNPRPAGNPRLRGTPAHVNPHHPAEGHIETFHEADKSSPRADGTRLPLRLPREFTANFDSTRSRVRIRRPLLPDAADFDPDEAALLRMGNDKPALPADVAARMAARRSAADLADRLAARRDAARAAGAAGARAAPATARPPSAPRGKPSAPRGKPSAPRAKPRQALPAAQPVPALPDEEEWPEDER
ncbi:hypothetical protein M885DRAFT_509500 [Pelagophyceae sp. CCMP2097]|nr:hypothetical protein M885DRAFT_509500 [Pelagophyceae sp. CCMP2097]